MFVLKNVAWEQLRFSFFYNEYRKEGSFWYWYSYLPSPFAYFFSSGPTLWILPCIYFSPLAPLCGYFPFFIFLLWPHFVVTSLSLFVSSGPTFWILPSLYFSPLAPLCGYFPLFIFLLWSDVLATPLLLIFLL